MASAREALAWSLAALWAARAGAGGAALWYALNSALAADELLNDMARGRVDPDPREALAAAHAALGAARAAAPAARPGRPARRAREAVEAAREAVRLAAEARRAWSRGDVQGFQDLLRRAHRATRRAADALAAAAPPHILADA